MKSVLASAVRAVAPSLPWEIKNVLAHTRAALAKGRPWRWQRGTFQADDQLITVHFHGTLPGQAGVEHALARTVAPLPPDQMGEPFTLAASDLPFPGALRVPHYVEMEIALDRPVEALLEDCGEKIRRVILKVLPRIEMEVVSDPAGIAQVDETMLRPYALARHGPATAQLPAEVLQRLSRPPHGLLHILKLDGEPVACHLGSAGYRRGKRYWTAVRFGYVPRVFENSKLLHEINSANVFLATQYAKEQGADWYSLGMTGGQPDDGLLHWKRRRGAAINIEEQYEWYHLRPPARGAARLFWLHPMFSAGLAKLDLTLNVGLPGGLPEPEVLHRYREMRFRGIQAIAIHHDPGVDPALIGRLESHLAEQAGSAHLIRKACVA